MTYRSTCAIVRTAGRRRLASCWRPPPQRTSSGGLLFFTPRVGAARIDLIRNGLLAVLIAVRSLRPGSSRRETVLCDSSPLRVAFREACWQGSSGSVIKVTLPQRPSVC